MIEFSQQFKRPVEQPDALKIETEGTTMTSKIDNSALLILTNALNQPYCSAKVTTADINYRRKDQLRRQEFLHMPAILLVETLQFLLDSATAEELGNWIDEKRITEILEAREAGTTCFTLSNNGRQLRLWTELMTEENIESENHVTNSGNREMADIYANSSLEYAVEDALDGLGYLKETLIQQRRTENYSMTRYRRIKA